VAKSGFILLRWHREGFQLIWRLKGLWVVQQLREATPYRAPLANAAVERYVGSKVQ